jgi:hypothetical protein
VVVEVDRDPKAARGEVQLRDPAVRARVLGADLPLGEEVDVVLDTVDVAARRVAFRLAS